MLENVCEKGFPNVVIVKLLRVVEENKVQARKRKLDIFSAEYSKKEMCLFKFSFSRLIEVYWLENQKKTCDGSVVH